MSYYFNNGRQSSRPASDRQVSYIASLRRSRGLDALAFTGTSRQASVEIDRLLSLQTGPVDPAFDESVNGPSFAYDEDRTARREAAERDAFGGLAEAFPASRRPSRPTFPATDKQIAYFRSLVETRQAPADDREEGTVSGTYESVQEGTATSAQVSAAISILARQPRSTVKSDAPEVPAGRYAVEFDGTLKFYRVDRPTEGKWAGRTFVKVQASDNEFPVRGTAATGVLRAIARDPREASLRYGREIGSCGVCGRTLTDEDSRARGIGPVCAAATGW